MTKITDTPWVENGMMECIDCRVWGYKGKAFKDIPDQEYAGFRLRKFHEQAYRMTPGIAMASGNLVRWALPVRFRLHDQPEAVKEILQNNMTEHLQRAAGPYLFSFTFGVMDEDNKIVCGGTVQQYCDFLGVSIGVNLRLV